MPRLEREVEVDWTLNKAIGLIFVRVDCSYIRSRDNIECPKYAMNEQIESVSQIGNSVEWDLRDLRYTE